MTIDAALVPLPAHYVDELLALARRGGLDAVGVCRAGVFGRERAILHERKQQGLHGGMEFTYRNPDRSTDPSRTVDGARAIIVGALGYRRRARPSPAVAPAARVGAYAWRDYYARVRDAFAPVDDRLRADGHRAVVVADENCLVDRAAAVRAGLGFYGKNANVLLPGRGSWFVLGSLITDAPLVVDDPAPVPDGCGSCHRCIDACPTGAIVAPGVVDARRCLAWVLQAPGLVPREYRVAIGTRIYGCDDCQEICPPNLRHDRTASVAGDDACATASLLFVLGADDRELDDRFGWWYIHRRDHDLLRRNALIALGNWLAIGAPCTADIEQVLRRYLAHHRELLRAHAVWAARRAGRADLVPARATERSAMVRAEFDAEL